MADLKTALAECVRLVKKPMISCEAGAHVTTFDFGTLRAVYDLLHDHGDELLAVVEGWRPIETAPRDHTDILVGFDAASVWVVHVAWWRSLDDNPDFTDEDVGWWSYVRGSVTQEKLGGWRTPTHWIPLPEPPDAAIGAGE